MSGTELERWRDRPEADDAEARAGALFRSAEIDEPSPELDRAVRAITRGAQDRSRARRRVRTLVLVLAATGIAGIAGAASRGWTPLVELFTPHVAPRPRAAAPSARRTTSVSSDVSETSSIAAQSPLARRIGATLGEPAKGADAFTPRDEVITPRVAARERAVARAVPPIVAANATSTVNEVARPAAEKVAPVEDDAPDGPRSALRDESRLLASAVRALRAGDAEETLRLVARHHQAHPNGELSRDVYIVEVQALAQLGRTGAALDVLDGIALAAVKRELPLVVLRAELRARAGRCAEARGDVELARGSADLDAQLFSRTERVLETCRR